MGQLLKTQGTPGLSHDKGRNVIISSLSLIFIRNSVCFCFQVKCGQKKAVKIFAFLIVVQERCGLRCEESDLGSNSHYFKILMELWNILMELRANCGY